MEIGHLYPYWERERQALLDGLEQVVEKLKREKALEEVESVFNWIPEGGVRSINDTLRHIAYVEYYIIDKLILDREPKEILPGSVFPAEDYPTFDDCIKLMREVHEGTVGAYRGLRPADIENDIPAFGQVLPIERLLWSIVQQEAHHRGQIYLLLRMQGIAPPERQD
jgi:uncharacterized damage-inducible protein DinB